MKPKEFKELMQRVANALPALTPLQRERFAQLMDSAQQSVSPVVKALEQHQPEQCPHCHCSHIVRCGLRNSLQRYQCRGCGRTFNAATGTALARLRDKELLDAYAQCMCQGLTVGEAAEQLDISKRKAFRWRHRFLQSVVEHQPQGIVGLLEVDETYFRYSEKGSRTLTRPARRRGGAGKGGGRKAGDWVPVLTGCARGQPYTLDKVLEKVNEKQVTQALKDAVTPGETLVCTDGHAAYRRLKQTLGVETRYFLASYHGHAYKTFHVQTVNNHHEQIKTWIQRKLRGVATKYLPHYLAWHQLMKWNKGAITTHDMLSSALGRQVINT